MPRFRLIRSFSLAEYSDRLLDDFEQLRVDGGRAERLGHALPSPEAARNFL
jgi:hypothetical protein